MASSKERAWLAAHQKGSKALIKKLDAAHAKNPEYQAFKKKHGLEDTSSVKQVSKSQVDAKKEKARQALAAKAYGATKGTKMGGENGGGQEVRDTTVPLSPEQHSAVQAAARAAAAKPKKEKKPKAEKAKPAPKPAESRLDMIKRLASKKKMNNPPVKTRTADAVSRQERDYAADDLADTPYGGHRGRYSMDEARSDDTAYERALKYFKAGKKPPKSKSPYKQDSYWSKRKKSIDEGTAKPLQGTPVVSLSDLTDKDDKKGKYGQKVSRKLKADDPRVKFYSDKKEEAEQIDEISKKKLGNYVDAAGDQKAVSLMTAATSKDIANVEFHGKRYARRTRGIKKALGRLTKEEAEQIDEGKGLATFVSKDRNGNPHEFHVYSNKGHVGHEVRGSHSQLHPNVIFNANGKEEAKQHAQHVADLVYKGQHDRALAHLNKHGYNRWTNVTPTNEEVWDEPNPKSKSKALSASQKARAKARARAAGRSYPNLVDNMWASKLSEGIIDDFVANKIVAHHTEKAKAGLEAADKARTALSAKIEPMNKKIARLKLGAAYKDKSHPKHAEAQLAVKHASDDRLALKKEREQHYDAFKKTRKEKEANVASDLKTYDKWGLVGLGLKRLKQNMQKEETMNEGILSKLLGKKPVAKPKTTPAHKSVGYQGLPAEWSQEKRGNEYDANRQMAGLKKEETMKDKDDAPFEGPYKKSDNKGVVAGKNRPAGSSRARHLAKAAMKKMMKEGVEQLDEIGDTQKGRDRLSRYIDRGEAKSTRLGRAVAVAKSSRGRNRTPGKITNAVRAHNANMDKLDLARDRLYNREKAYGKKNEEVEQVDEAFINGREYAANGRMHPKHAAEKIHQVSDRYVDFYASGTGNKMQGKVIKNDGKSVHIQAHPKLGDGKLHKFTVTPDLPKSVNEVNARHSFTAAQQALTPRAQNIKAALGKTARDKAATNKYARRIAKISPDYSKQDVKDSLKNMGEEAEQIDELSKDFLTTKYGPKAMRAHLAAKAAGKREKANKRAAGVNMASKKAYPSQYVNSSNKAKVPATNEEVKSSSAAALNPGMKEKIWAKYKEQDKATSQAPADRAARMKARIAAYKQGK